MTDSQGTGPTDWKQAHQALLDLQRVRGALDADEGILLLAAMRSGAHRKLGYASFIEYVERSFGHGPRWTEERLRVAEALEQLPLMKAALRSGKLVWSAVRELTRVATRDNEAQWLDVAAGRSVRDVERLVAGHARGDHPDDPPDRGLVRHVLRFEVSAEVLATFREAVGVLKRQSGGALSDEEALLLMARHTLGGSTDAARSNYQIGVTVCGECQRGWQHGRGELVELSPEAVAMAECDAVHLGAVDGAPTDGAQTAARADSAIEKNPEREDNGTAPANDNTTHVGATTAASRRADRASHGDTHVGRSHRTTQTIPPRTRRKVLHRDGHRCIVPGCRHALYLDVHHLDPRADGGGHASERLVTLCSAHHAQVHHGRLLIQGTHGRLRFRHADGSPYGEPASPMLIDLYHKVHLALRCQGFGETETRRALEQLRRDNTGVRTSPTLESVLRRAFAVLVA